MAHRWTAAQQAAINITGCDMLVSAAAGSGKTAALTERVIRSLTREDDPCDITRILAVTFTRASAAELRRRISKALSGALTADPGNKRLIRQLMLLGSAKISTIDSFYNEIVRSNFQRLSLPAGLRIADEAELKLLSKSLMEDIIDRGFAASGDPAVARAQTGEESVSPSEATRADDPMKYFAALADHFTGNKDDRQLADFFINLYENVRKYPEGIEYLKFGAEKLSEEADKPFFETRAGHLISSSLSEELVFYLKILEAALIQFSENEKQSAAYSDGFSADRDHITSLLAALEKSDYEGAREVALSYKPKGLRPLKGIDKTQKSETYKLWRDKIRDRLRKIAAEDFRRPAESIPETFKKTSDICLQLYIVLSQYEKEMREEKLSRGICDFEDIRRYTLELLIDNDGNPTDIAQNYAARFDEILIDEYQDVDGVQDMIFRALSVSSRRFMVGDIKQSIYGFRGAEPSLFAGYRAAFPPWSAGEGGDKQAYARDNQGEECRGKIERPGVSVFMSENFRCGKNIVDFVNLVCSRIFPACGTSVGYLPEDDLIFSKELPEGYLSPPVEVTLIHKGEPPEEGDKGEVMQEQQTADQPEMRYIAAEISRLLAEGKREDGKPIKPSDIAVLCRTRSVCGKVSDALGTLGIHCVSDSSEKYSSDPEVSLMISLLTFIDNPEKDIPAAAVMRSPVFGFTMDELTRIRKRAGKSVSLFEAAGNFATAGDEETDCAQKCRDFIARVKAYRVLSRSLPADRLMRRLMRDIPVFSLSGGGGRILELYEYARQFEAGSFKGLYNFIKYVNNAIEVDAALGVGGAEPGEGAVTVITIHHSKGLEFPICFVAGCGMSFNTARSAKSDFIPDREVGPAARIKDATGLAKINTQIRRAALAGEVRRETEEEMRLLYVAMTRARERLYLTAYCRTKLESKLAEAEFRRLYGGDFGVLSASSYLDWLLLSLAEGKPEGAPYRFKILTEKDIPLAYRVSTDQSPAAEPAPKYDSAELEKLFDANFAYTYPHAHLTRIPAKLSVSKLYPGALDREDDAGAELIEGGGIVIGGEEFGASGVTAADRVPTPGGMRIKKFTITPEFLARKPKEAKGAERGTATHLFLQFCDFSRCLERGIESELAYLAEKRFMSRRLVELVNIRQIKRFFESDLFASLAGARWSRREQRFNILLPASHFSEDPDFSSALSREELLVQGVIDLFFEDANGNLILADYKTDYLTKEELANPSLAARKLGERHRTQLSYYAAALARICGRRPDCVLIYSLPLGGVVEVEVEAI